MDGRKPTTLQCGRIAQRTAGIGAAGNGRQSAGQRDGGATGRSAARLRQVVRIAGRTENFVECLRSGAKFRSVGFTDDDRACATHPCDNKIVFGGDVVLVKRRSKGSADAAGFHQVLVRNGKAVQRA
jgi:hypothetical protein